MAKNSRVTASAENPEPAPVDETQDLSHQPKPWQPPEGDTEFEFTTIADAPEWVNRSWAGFSRGKPALVVPTSPLNSPEPWNTAYAHPGDTVKYNAKTMTLSVVPANPEEAGFPQAKADDKYGADRDKETA